jgi:hypothetical protein
MHPDCIIWLALTHSRHSHRKTAATLESEAFEELFEQLIVKPKPSPKLWSDAYLAAFGRTAGPVIVTFGRGFPTAGPASVTVF